MTRIPKIVALLAFGMAAGCRESYPNQQPALNILAYPVGMAVRQMAPVPGVTGKEFGWTQLVVVNSNFDLRFDEQTGGTVLVVDPDASQDTSAGGALSVLGGFRTASFGGEVAIADTACLPGWPDCPSACPTLAADPTLAAGGAKVILASRSGQIIYNLSMSSDGALGCTGTCQLPVPIDRINPYGVSLACSAQAGYPVAYAFVSHLATANGIGWLSRVNLLVDGDVLGLVMGSDGTYATAFDSHGDRLFVSSTVPLNGQFRWFNPLVTVSEVNGFAVPEYSSPFFSNFLSGAVARGMAFSSDGTRLYVSVILYDLSLALQTGAIVTQGGAIAVFDLTESSFAQPRMALLEVKPTCLGAGQIRRLPSRAGKPDLFAVTCDAEGALALYDAGARSIVTYLGLDTTTGLPGLGLSPFGIATEPIDARRATPHVQGSAYDPSPCGPGRDCQRIYVGSFINDWINVLELDPDRPSQVGLVKRIGRGP